MMEAEKEMGKDGIEEPPLSVGRAEGEVVSKSETEKQQQQKAVAEPVRVNERPIAVANPPLVPVQREHVARRARMDAFLMQQSGYQHQSGTGTAGSSSASAVSGTAASPSHKSQLPKMNGPLSHVRQQATTPRSSSWSRAHPPDHRLTQSMSARTPRSKSMGRTKPKDDEDRSQAEAAFREWLKRKATEPRMPKASPSRDQIARHLREESKQRVMNRWHNKKVIRTFQPGDEHANNGSNATL